MSCVSLLLIFFCCSYLITGMASINVPEQPFSYNPKELGELGIRISPIAGNLLIQVSSCWKPRVSSFQLWRNLTETMDFTRQGNMTVNSMFPTCFNLGNLLLSFQTNFYRIISWKPAIFHSTSGYLI